MCLSVCGWGTEVVVPAGNAPASSGYQPGALLLSYGAARCTRGLGFGVLSFELCAWSMRPTRNPERETRNRGEWRMVWELHPRRPEPHSVFRTGALLLCQPSIASVPGLELWVSSWLQSQAWLCGLRPRNRELKARNGRKLALAEGVSPSSPALEAPRSMIELRERTPGRTGHGGRPLLRPCEVSVGPPAHPGKWLLRLESHQHRPA